MQQPQLPPGQQLVAAEKWPIIGERASRPDSAPWSVHVGGAAAARPYALALVDLGTFPQVERTVDIHCVTRWSKLGVQFSGVPLSVLVEMAEPDPSAKFVSFVARSVRGHSTSLSLDDALALNTLVALSADGVPLDEQHGGPVRVIVAGRYFYKSLKWLERIDLVTEDRLGFWETTAGYHNTADPWRRQRYMACGITKAEARSILEQRDISGRDLRSLDAQGRDLCGLIAKDALLRDADFRRCRLQDACFDRANLTNAHLQKADLRDASFRDADLEGANFCGADLRGACMLGASLCAATFCAATGLSDDVSGNAVLDHRTQIERSALEDLTPDQHAFLRTTLLAAGQ